MSLPQKDFEHSREFVKQSTLYQEFLAEREEILRHKWLESERLGYDIGFERALLDWIRKHREGWRAARRAQLGSQGTSTGSQGSSTTKPPFSGQTGTPTPSAARPGSQIPRELRAS
ncbi:hypothetical protein GALL_09920 [mine drainage metagenome]|uniref:DUF4032 domain-containing protein n=1 Tax=mine drainage metagenome TaxID=410659 RepID=A0A1J5TQR7_9ZZZZ